MAVNTRILFVERPTGTLTDAAFRIEEDATLPPGPGEALVKVRWLSIDAANRVWMNPQPSYRKPLQPGQVMAGAGIGEVLTSNDPSLSPGDIVEGDLGWQSHAVVEAKRVLRVRPVPGLPLSYYLGALGLSGRTAWIGLHRIGQPKEGETVVVSGAAGGAGNIAAQIARLRGCRVVGIAGGPKKCAVLQSELGVHATIDYKAGDVAGQLKTACPDGIDVYFDNVGGPILQACLFRMKPKGRVVCCGAVSSYNATKPHSIVGIPGLLVVRRIRMEGFVVMDHLDLYSAAEAELSAWIKADKLVVLEDVVDGLENAPAALMGLLSGDNIGKRVVRVS